MKATAPASCQWSADNQVLTLKLNERFDYESIHSFHRVLRQAQPEDEIVVDMGCTRYIDSSGLGLLIGLQRAMRSQHKPIAVINCCPAIRQILKACHLERRFDIS